MTMPGKGQLHRFLARAYKQGATHAVVEVTSEGIVQHRHAGIHFAVVAYTNITPEHIERHGSFAAYTSAKLSLMKALKRGGVVVWNRSDKVLAEHQEQFLPYRNVPVAVPSYDAVVDVFRCRNTFFARAVVQEGLGVAIGDSAVVDTLFIPGRFEVYRGATTVVVDYAHTLEALPLCLRAVRAMTTGRVIHVFGAAGGGRDRYKRPRLAAISECFADVHVLTEENSFDEPVAAIMDDIAAGFTAGHDVTRYTLREDAVRYAIAIAGPSDVVVCTAKGSETVIAGPQKTMRPYHEREFVQSCLSQKIAS
jgi:UDP-N-acetylmuramoyl-L-alanyl-D-glutamate--2,6-diaminopimelate ligase